MLKEYLSVIMHFLGNQFMGFTNIFGKNYPPAVNVFLQWLIWTLESRDLGNFRFFDASLNIFLLVRYGLLLLHQWSRLLLWTFTLCLTQSPDVYSVVITVHLLVSTTHDFRCHPAGGSKVRLLLVEGVIGFPEIMLNLCLDRSVKFMFR